MTYVVKDLRMYVTKSKANRAIITMREYLENIEENVKLSIPLAHWSFKPETDPRYQDLILTLRRILSKNGMQLLQDRPVSDLLSMQRYMQYQEQSNLLQFILQDLTDKEIRNLQSLVQRAEKLSKTPGLDGSCILRDAEKIITEKEFKDLILSIDIFNRVYGKEKIV